MEGQVETLLNNAFKSLTSNRNLPDFVLFANPIPNFINKWDACMLIKTTHHKLFGHYTNFQF